MTSRRGRPPKVVNSAPGEYETTVDKVTYKFRKGGDGKLRTLGNPDRESDSFKYARERVNNVAQQQEAETNQ